MVQLQQRLHDIARSYISSSDRPKYKERDTAGGHETVLLSIPNFVLFQLGAYSMSADQNLLDGGSTASA